MMNTENDDDNNDASPQNNVKAKTTKDGVEEEQQSPTISVATSNSSCCCSCCSGCSSCCSWYQFGGSSLAKGYCTLGMGRGPLVMSNIFLTTAFIYLASEQAGCLEVDPESDDDDALVVVEDCPNTVYGFKPVSLISSIAVISGLLAAFFMPLAGAMIDYTPHRRLVGIISACVMVAIQAVQAGTVQATWFSMAILQAIIGFVYQMQVLSVYAYLPEMARDVGEERTRNYQARFTMTQFGSQSAFLVVVIALSIALGLDDVETSHLSQAINVVWISICFYIGWKLLPSVPAKNTLKEDQYLLTQGFIENFRTMKNIQQHYNRGLFRFLLAVIFAEAGVNAFTIVAVVYLNEQLGLNGTEIGIFFLITLLASIPGALLGAKVTSRLNPVRSWQICLSCLTIVTIVGSVILEGVSKNLSYCWGICIGVFLGWHYPTEGLIFSVCLPKGREAELSGFYVYCTQILGWAPPLVFSALVEADVSQVYGVWSVTVFIIIAICIMQIMAPWAEILEETQKPDLVKEMAAMKDDEETRNKKPLTTPSAVGMSEPTLPAVLLVEDSVETEKEMHP